MRRYMIAFAAIVAVGVGLCGRALSSSRGEGIRSLTSTLGSRGYLAAPQTPPGLMVRPDIAVIPIQFEQNGPDARHELAALEKTANELGARLKTETQGAAALRLNLLDMGELRGELYEAGQGRASGVIEVALAPEASYWTRMNLLLQVTGGVRAFAEAHKGKKDEELEIHTGNASFRVKDAERYREQLLQTWTKRVREFSSAVQSPSSPLLVSQCEPPGDIKLADVSMEEVALQLEVVCHLVASAK